jgi:hypothetical protein
MKTAIYLSGAGLIITLGTFGLELCGCHSVIFGLPVLLCSGEFGLGLIFVALLIRLIVVLKG